MASQLLGIKTRFTNDLGSPLVGGQVYTYFAGTSTNQDSYSDAALTVPNTNPVILDDTGSADIFLKGSYRIRVFDASGRFIEEQDNVTQAASQGDATEINERIDAVQGDIGKVKLDTGITATAKFGGVERGLSDKLSDTVNALDFGASSNQDSMAIKKAIDYSIVSGKKVVFDFDVTIRVPTHSATIDAAIHSVSNSNRCNITILIESGHLITNGFSVSNGDYSNFTISSEDEQVSVASDFVGVGSYQSLMLCISATAPKWNIFADMRGFGGNGITLLEGSNGFIYPQKGVRGATGLGNNLTAGLFLSSSRVTAEYSKFIYNGRNLWVTVGSQAFIQSSDLSYALEIGEYVSRASTVALSSANLSYAGNVGLWLLNSVVHAGTSKIHDCATYNIYLVRASILHIADSNLQNGGTYGIYCDQASTAFAAGSNTTGAGNRGFFVGDGGHIVKTGGIGTYNVVDLNIWYGVGCITDTSAPALAPMRIKEDGTTIINDDWDNIRTTGIYKVSTRTAVGIPSSSAGWACTHTEYTPTTATQLAVNGYEDSVKFRRRTDSVWRTWVTVL